MKEFVPLNAIVGIRIARNLLYNSSIVTQQLCECGAMRLFRLGNTTPSEPVVSFA